MIFPVPYLEYNLQTSGIPRGGYAVESTEMRISNLHLFIYHVS